MQLKIDPVLKALIPPLTAEELRLLEYSLLEEGCRDSLITWNDTIIDGHNRFEICNKHGIPYRTEDRDFDSIEDVKAWMINNQFSRRNLSNYQRSILALELEALFKEKAKERQKGGKGGVLLTQNSAEARGETREQLAKIAQVSHDTIAKVKLIKEQAPEEVKQKLEAGTVSINEAYTDIKREQKKAERDKQIEEVRQKIQNEELVAPTGKFDVIAIDPPWAYDEKGGFSSNEYHAEQNRGAVDYPTMTVAEIAALDLPAKDDSVLFLWTTHAFLRDAFDLVNTWGYTYKATIVWDKEHMGMGRNIRMQCEFCLLAIKGKPLLNGSSERDIIREARREHSRKPEAFYAMVDRMCVGRKLDYFSREQRNEWSTYGAEATKF